MRCKGLIINCMDPRLQGENLVKIADAAGLKSGEYEVLTYPGPSLWMTDPHQPSDADVFWWTLENVSTGLHHISKMVIVGHSECGGFALKGASKEPETERDVIVGTFAPAAQAVVARHPKLDVIPVFVKIGKTPEHGALPDIEVTPVEAFVPA